MSDDIRIMSSVPRGTIKQALFDFDGTVSTIREGWEEVMGPYMVEVLSELDDDEERVKEKVYRYIDESTGIQTILQMEWLAVQVKNMGGKPLDPFEYKAEYNRRLMERVERRIEMLRRGEVSREDLMVRGVLRCLEHLRSKGIRMYVASGTDRDDVRREAEILGVASYFDGGIYGAIGRIEDYSKEKVIKQIIAEHDLHGSELVVFGDGPVEIRNAKAVGAIGIGVAVDERRGYGWSERKIDRLSVAGADVLIPDFSVWDRLAELLGV